MSCPECSMQRDQIAIAQEEACKLRERIASDLAADKSSPQSLKSLQTAERSLERCMRSLERHLESGDTTPGSARTVSHTTVVWAIICMTFILSSCSRRSGATPSPDFEWKWPRPGDVSHSLSDSVTATTCRFKKTAIVSFDDSQNGINYWIAPEPETDTMSFSDLGTKKPRIAYRDRQEDLEVAGDANGLLTLVNPSTAGEVYVIDRKRALLMHSSLTPFFGTRGDIEMGYCQ